MDMSFFIQIIIFSYGVVFANFAIAVLCLKNKTRIHYLAANLLAAVGLMCIDGGICVYSKYRGIAVNLAVFFPMLAIAPIGARFALDCLGVRRSSNRLQLFIHAGTAFVLVAGLAMVFWGLSWRVLFSMVYAWLFVVYLLIVVIEGYALRPISVMPTGLRRFYLTACLDVLLIGSMLFFQILDYYPGLYILWTVLIFSLLGIIFIAFHSPETFRLLEEAAVKIRYEHSSLEKKDIEEQIRKLGEIMLTQKMYRNNNLRLEDLARCIDLSPHQLSELLNLHLGKNFAWYVNSFRLEHAKEMLIDQPGLSVLDVAFDCGFNSKSVFNSVFRSYTGLTPTDFRKAAHPRL